MANFLLLVDPDADRRARFIKRVEPLVAPVDGLVTAGCSSGDFSVIWAAQERAPVSYIADDGGAAVVWGDAIGEEGSKRLDAGALRARWANVTVDLPAPLDGFHAAAVFESSVGLTVGADVLGLFPVYYYANGEVLLVGSSPELFRYHPAFQMEVDPLGLVGILLMMHLLDGYTLIRNVRRLASGHLLIWRPGRGALELQQYRIPTSMKHFDLSFSAQVEILGEALEEAVLRHAPPGKPYGLLLSGGLDSRTLAGYLRANGQEVVALTLGLPTDIEVTCARAVARMLGFEHRIADISESGYPGYAELQARWEHGGNGFNTIAEWGVRSYLRELPAHVISGHLMDCVLGGPHPAFTDGPALSFDTVFAYFNGWGIHPEMLRALLRREVFGDQVEEAISQARAVYEDYGESEFQRAWCFELHHRQRFHVGSEAWRMSFGAWPVLPAMDRQVLLTAGAMPAATIAERRAEVELLCKRFPALAELPLDRNSYNVEPLRPRLRRLLTQYVARRIIPRTWTRRIERRRYRRVFDINGPGWLAVRQRAERFRKLAYEFFHRDAFDALLPPPDVPIRCRNPIADASGLKSLLGFLLWLGDHK